MNQLNPSAIEQRTSSRVQRTVRNGVAVYEKQYVTNDWDDDFAVVQRRARDEAELLRTLAASGLFGGRLGVVNIAASNPDAATIATHEVPGTSLGEYLLHGVDVRTNLMPWFLAGRWLQRFHEIPLTRDSSEFVSKRDPTDLVEYCDLRLRSLADYGYKWPGDTRRRSILETIGQLREKCTPFEMRSVWVHSDFSPGNLMWDGRVLTPIDFAMVSSGSPLADATYLIHRVEMQRVYRPWIQVPVESIRQAILRGLGLPDGESLAAYQMLMIKHQICRLHTYVRRPPNSLKQSLHDRWVRKKLERSLNTLAQAT